MKKNRKLTRDHLQKKKPLEHELLIPGSPEDAARVERAEADLGRARLLQQDVEAAEAALEAVREEVAENGSYFLFRGIGRKPFEKLVREHPPTAEDTARDKDSTWNPETFWPALCAASCANSDLTAEDWQELVFDGDNWGPGELKRIRDAALHVNTDSQVVSLGN